MHVVYYSAFAAAVVAAVAVEKVATITAVGTASALRQALTIMAGVAMKVAGEAMTAVGEVTTMVVMMTRSRIRFDSTSTLQYHALFWKELHEVAWSGLSDAVRVSQQHTAAQR